jgi:hypothetical protein
MISPESNSHSSAPLAFISHSSVDAALASDLCSRLESRDVRCWIAPRDVTLGNSYADEIVAGIEGCQFLILLATANAISSDNVLNELEQAHKLHRGILTIMIRKPTVSRQLDYYIGRLHWIESAGDNTDLLANKLAEVLQGTKSWPAVASPPSIGRRVRHAMPAFAGSLLAICLVLIVLAVLGWYALGRAREAIATDYRSLGWITISSSANSEGTLSVNAHLWLSDGNLPFGDTKLILAMQGPHQLVHVDASSSMNLSRTGDLSVPLKLPADTSNFTTYFAIPRAKSQKRYCIQQHFTIDAKSTDVSVNEVGEAKVSEITAKDKCL